MSDSALSRAALKWVGTNHVDLGSGWWQVSVASATDENVKNPLWYLVSDSPTGETRRVLMQLWLHENCKGKWVIESSSIIFKEEDDALLFAMAL